MSMLATPVSMSPETMQPGFRPDRAAPVLNLQDIALPGGRLSLRTEVGDIALIEGLPPLVAWRVLAIGAGFAFGGPGRCEHGGVDTRSLTAQERATLRARMVARAMLCDELDIQRSLLDNVLDAGLQRGVPASLVRHQALHALESLGLQALQNEPVSALSLAHQRLGVMARALACHAPLLVLERPENHLDDQQVTLLRSAIWLAAFDSGSCVLMTTGHALLASLAQRGVGPVVSARN
jgi:ABC-type lipoprotein export system ATPase subunit